MKMQDDPMWEVHSREDPDLSLFDFRRIIKRIWKIHRKCPRASDLCWHIERFYVKIGFWESERAKEVIGETPHSFKDVESK